MFIIISLTVFGARHCCVLRLLIITWCQKRSYSRANNSSQRVFLGIGSGTFQGEQITHRKLTVSRVCLFHIGHLDGPAIAGSHLCQKLSLEDGRK